MHLVYRRATPEDIPQCYVLRGLTRQNAVSAQRLEQAGITIPTWAQATRSGELIGHVCLAGSRIAGYCFGSSETGEVVVLALLPAFENRGIGRTLLLRVVDDLVRAGHRRLYLGCSSDPSTRSHGFYRRLGWRSTGTFDARGDEVLELFPPANNDVLR